MLFVIPQFECGNLGKKDPLMMSPNKIAIAAFMIASLKSDIIVSRKFTVILNSPASWMITSKTLPYPCFLSSAYKNKKKA